MSKIVRWVGRRKKDVKKKLITKKYGVESVPTVLSVALTNKCNADCIYCRREHKEINPDMQYDFYQSLIVAMPFIEEMQPQINGEPLLYPSILEAIIWAKAHEKRVVMYTNGTFLTTDMGRDLLNCEVDKVIFSIDECEKERFENLRRKNTWERVLVNVETFQFLRDHGGYTTKTSVRICITPENKDRMDEIKSFWASRVDEVAAMPEMYMPNNCELENQKSSSGEPIECNLSYDNIAVDTNGNLLLCCSDYFDSFELGNLHDIEPLTAEKILELYNSVEFIKIRRALKNGQEYPYKCHVCQGRSGLVLER